MKRTYVSIIIPTYNDWDRLALCINALGEQTYPKHLYEIIVVNNNTKDTAPENFIIPANCRIIAESKPGSYAARNAAINISNGEIIGFTDSDCIPDKNWITNATTFFNSQNIFSRLAGKIDLFYNSSKLSKVELYEKIYAFNQDIYVKNDGTAVTANMFALKEVFAEIGLFDETLMSGGDYEWSVRAKNAGHKIKYVDDVIVNHPARIGMGELIKKAKRVGGGQAGFSKRRRRPVSSLIRFIYDLRPPVKSFKLIHSKGKDLQIQQKFLVGYIRYYLSIITAYEKFKVQVGKKAPRA